MSIAESVAQVKELNIDQEWLDYLDEIIVLGTLLGYDVNLHKCDFINTLRGRNNVVVNRVIGYIVGFIREDFNAFFSVFYVDNVFEKIDGYCRDDKFTITYQRNIDEGKNKFKEWL